MYKILLVEDSEETRRLVVESLGKDFEWTLATTFEEGSNFIDKNRYDLVLLDITLPDGDGYQLCSLLQGNEETANTPVIFLTANDDRSHRIMGYTLGAEDYIAKPFDPLELRLRITTRLKKISKRRESYEIIRKGNVIVNLSAQKAFVMSQGKKEDLGLTPIEFRLLLYFVLNSEHVLSRDYLLSEVWGNSVHVSHRSIDSHVSKLKKKMLTEANTIQSVYGCGYVFSPNPENQIGKTNGTNVIHPATVPTAEPQQMTIQ